MGKELGTATSGLAGGTNRSIRVQRLTVVATLMTVWLLASSAGMDAGGVSAAPRRAQSQPPGLGVSYAAGWNLVAAPQGTVFTGASGSLYTFQPGDTSYETLSSNAPLHAGFGYWAFLSAPTTETLPAGSSQSVTRSLPSGQFVMVGNPFSTPATITGADTAFTYNPAVGSYQAATTLQPGQGAWALSSGGAVTISPLTAPQAAQFGDDHFGVTLGGEPQQLLTLGTRWFITYGSTLSFVPAGSVWVQYLDLETGKPIEADLASRVAQHPGSYWLMSNEPNVTGSPQQMSGDQYAHALHDAVAVIQQADPSAKIVAPNIINFDFTCIDCPGYTSGHDWMDAFLTAYQADYSSLPPVDIWSIHTYPLDWDHFPQVDASIVEDQLTEFRKYLDSKPGLAGAPMWDTELGTHWGFQGIDWHDDGTGTIKAFPVGSYQTDQLLGYMQNVLGWLDANGPSLNIQRWFFFSTYVSQPEAWETVYGGIDLFSGTGANATLTPFGQLYRQLAGLGP